MMKKGIVRDVGLCVCFKNKVFFCFGPHNMREVSGPATRAAQLEVRMDLRLLCFVVGINSNCNLSRRDVASCVVRWYQK